MKWTPVDSHGQDVVLKPLATGRDVFDPDKPQNCSFGLTQASTFQPGQPTLGAFRHSEPLRALFYPVRGQFDNSEDS